MSNEKLSRLTQKDIWVFTKQSVDFDNAFKAVKLFNEMPNRGLLITQPKGIKMHF